MKTILSLMKRVSVLKRIFDIRYPLFKKAERAIPPLWILAGFLAGRSSAAFMNQAARGDQAEHALNSLNSSPVENSDSQSQQPEQAPTRRVRVPAAAAAAKHTTQPTIKTRQRLGSRHSSVRI